MHDTTIRGLLKRIELVADAGLGHTPGRRPAPVTLRLKNGSTSRRPRTCAREIPSGR
jgi:hypothetical protein